jgi:transcriptional regulator with XRE-family HTH domain/predicted Fe-Mo cluster-binding NifX family protein
MDVGPVDPNSSNPNAPAEAQVGRRLRDLRNRRGYSLRALADRSGLNVNTLSLVENGKTSPSVSTLQQLARALDVPIVSFFESEPPDKKIVYTPAGQRPQEVFGSTQMQNLAQNLAGSTIQPFMVTLNPGTGSGERMIVHTGHEFVFCLSGTIHYRIQEQDYTLKIGDSLVFEAHLPHCWENNGEDTAQILLVLVPTDEREEPGGRHFSAELINKEIHMKIAVITDDGKTISQHFGRALHYMVFTVEDGKVINRELRDKLGHNHFSGGEHHEHHGAGHGQDAASHNRHAGMAEAISDCQMLICGGMGYGAYQSMLQLKIKPVVTEIGTIDEAVQAAIAGTIVDRTEFLH